MTTKKIEVLEEDQRDEFVWPRLGSAPVNI